MTRNHPSCLCLTSQLQDSRGNTVSLRPPPLPHHQSHLAALEASTNLTDSSQCSLDAKGISQDAVHGCSDLSVQYFQWHMSESKCTNLVQVELGLARHIGTTYAPNHNFLEAFLLLHWSALLVLWLLGSSS